MTDFFFLFKNSSAKYSRESEQNTSDITYISTHHSSSCWLAVLQITHYWSWFPHTSMQPGPPGCPAPTEINQFNNTVSSESECTRKNTRTHTLMSRGEDGMSFWMALTGPLGHGWEASSGGDVSRSGLIGLEQTILCSGLTWRTWFSEKHITHTSTHSHHRALTSRVCVQTTCL